MQRIVVTASAVALVLTLGLSAWLWWGPTSQHAAEVTASGSTEGTSPRQLLGSVDRLDATEVGTRSPRWVSKAPAVGEWVQVDWNRPTRVNRVRVLSAGRSPQFASALMTFDSGSTLLIHADAQGDVDVTFPVRDVRFVRLSIASTVASGADDPPAAQDAVRLAALAVDGSGMSAVSPLPIAAPVTVSASSHEVTAQAALMDGDAEQGWGGDSWRAAADDTAPWVELRWRERYEVSSIQVRGPPEEATDPRRRAAAQLHGRVTFDDGSAVVVSGVAGAAEQPTTIAFAPRMTSWVRLELFRTLPGADLALQEFTAYGSGTTPGQWPASIPGSSYQPPESGCGPQVGVGTPPGPDRLLLVCPAVGSAVGESVGLRIAGPPGSRLSAVGSRVTRAGKPLPRSVLATSTVGDDGVALLAFPTADLAHGPFGVAVTGSDETQALDELHLSFFNSGGRALVSLPTAPPGMTLQWNDDFDGPVSASTTGDSAVYGARKPTANGAEGFGDAAFADPAADTDTLGTYDGFLRLRAEPTEGRTELARYGEKYLGALLSSAHLGGSGFAAQYGYFEARMLGGGGPGSWPAFWTLNTQSATTDDDTAGEGDVVELYGHNPTGSCHSVHDHDPALDEIHDGKATCLDTNGFEDWTLAWHTYGMRVTPDGATFFIDGVAVAEERHLGRTDEPFFFLLNQALGGGWPVDLSGTQGITDTYVDWVRVYT